MTDKPKEKPAPAPILDRDDFIKLAAVAVFRSAAGVKLRATDARRMVKIMGIKP